MTLLSLILGLICLISNQNPAEHFKPQKKIKTVQRLKFGFGLMRPDVGGGGGGGLACVMLQCLRRQREFGGSACQRLRRHHDCGVAGHADVNGGSSAAPSKSCTELPRSCARGWTEGFIVLFFFLLLLSFPAALCSLKGPGGRSGWKSSERARDGVGGGWPDPKGGTQDVN